MFALRALTAAVLLALLIGGVLLLEPAWFALVVAGIVAIGAHEWARLAGLGNRGARVYAAAQVAAFAALWNWSEGWTAPLLLAACWSLAAVFWLLVVPLWLAKGVRPESRIALRLAGFAVLAPAALAMATLSAPLMLALLGIVWIADTAAYLAGRAYGRHKLAPGVSPGKTWEGAAGGMLASLAYAIIVAMLWRPLEEHVSGAGWAGYLAGVSLLCTIGILGDLFESALKRQAGVKDSGTLLPGHGGVLDRIDSATAVLPLGALLARGAGLA